MKPASLPLAAALFVLSGSVPAAVTATFDDLLAPPALTGSTNLFFANGASANYQGVIWDSRFRVVGDAYRIAPPDGPLFGLPKSPAYFVTNEASVVGGTFTNDGLLMTTTLALTEVWFGQNEYYGFGGGADEVTVRALHGSDILGSVSLVLPDDTPGQPEPLRKMDTVAFLSLTGVTGYRIDRHAQGVSLDGWVADNFVFQSPVPEPSTTWLLLLGFGGILAVRCVQVCPSAISRYRSCEVDAEAPDRLRRRPRDATTALGDGIHRRAAIGLYERLGFRPIPPFGEYREDPLSRF